MNTAEKMKIRWRITPTVYKEKQHSHADCAVLVFGIVNINNDSVYPAADYFPVLIPPYFNKMSKHEFFI